MANLDSEDYAQIGNYMRKAAEEYVAAWKPAVDERAAAVVARDDAGWKHQNAVR